MQALEELTCRHILLGPPANPEDQDHDWRAERPSSLTYPHFTTGGVVRDEGFEIAGPSSAAPQYRGAALLPDAAVSSVNSHGRYKPIELRSAL
jgi:hypothetical protein